LGEATVREYGGRYLAKAPVTAPHGAAMDGRGEQTNLSVDANLAAMRCCRRRG